MNQTAPNAIPTESLEAVQDRLDFARKLQALTNRIHATDNIGQIMNDLSSEICDLFLCERMTLYVVNKERGVLVSKVKTGIDAAKDIVLPISRQSIAGYVAATRNSVRIKDLDDEGELKSIHPDLRFFSQVDNVTGFKSKQMMAAPLVQLPGREVVGVVQLINQRADGRFDKVAEEGLEALTTTLAQALAQRMKTAAMLPRLYDALAADGVIAAPELDLAQRWAQRKNKDLELVLVDDFGIALATMGKAIARQCGLDYQPLNPDWFPDRELTRKLDRAAAQQQQWLPFKREGNIIAVVTAEPDIRANKQSMNQAFPYNEVVARFTTRTEFRRMLDLTWPAS